MRKRRKRERGRDRETKQNLKSQLCVQRYDKNLGQRVCRCCDKLKERKERK